MQSLFVAMALNPEVQKKARAELDAVVGPNRLPEFEDQQGLVYVNAVMKEALRWQVVLPFSVPHKTMQDDEFRGYFIPAGTVILPNVWYGNFSLLIVLPTSASLIPFHYRACTHNPELYEDPDEFRPERFIRDGKLDFTSAPDPALFVFGFGRR